MIDWFSVVVICLAVIAGGIGGSARPGDRVRDIPQVFMRRPVALIASGVGASVFYLVTEVARNG